MAKCKNSYIQNGSNISLIISYQRCSDGQVVSNYAIPPSQARTIIHFEGTLNLSFTTDVVIEQRNQGSVESNKCIPNCAVLTTIGVKRDLVAWEPWSRRKTNLRKFITQAPKDLGYTNGDWYFLGITHTNNKLWYAFYQDPSSKDTIPKDVHVLEYDITLCNFQASYNRTLVLPGGMNSYTVKATRKGGRNSFQAWDDNLLIFNGGVGARTVYYWDISTNPPATPTVWGTLPSGFLLQPQRITITSNNKMFVSSSVDASTSVSGGRQGVVFDPPWFYQIDLSNFALDWYVSPTIGLGIKTHIGKVFSYDGKLYATQANDCNGLVRYSSPLGIISIDCNPNSVIPNFLYSNSAPFNNNEGGNLFSQTRLCNNYFSCPVPPTPTPSQTVTPSVTPTQTPTPSPQTPTPTPTNTVTPSVTPTRPIRYYIMTSCTGLTQTIVASSTPLQNGDVYLVDLGSGLEGCFTVSQETSNVGSRTVVTSYLDCDTCIGLTPTPTSSQTPTPTPSFSPTPSFTPSPTPTSNACINYEYNYNGVSGSCGEPISYFDCDGNPQFVFPTSGAWQNGEDGTICGNNVSPTTVCSDMSILPIGYC